MKYELGGMQVAILLTSGFEQVELTGPRETLDEAGTICKILSVQLGKVQGFHHDEKGDLVDVDQTIDVADPDEFDAVLVPGGAANGEHLRMAGPAVQFVRQMHEQGKPVATICHGVALLVSAGILRGRTVTSAHDLAQEVRDAGGNWVDLAAAVDGNLVTSRGPEDIPAFSAAFLDLLKARFAASVHGTRDQEGTAIGASS